MGDRWIDSALDKMLESCDEELMYLREFLLQHEDIIKLKGCCVTPDGKARFSKPTEIVNETRNKKKLNKW